jgi:two-component system, LuxR family, response regulator FixJ
MASDVVKPTMPVLAALCDPAIRTTLEVFVKYRNVDLVVYDSSDAFLSGLTVKGPGCLLIDFDWLGEADALQQQITCKGIPFPSIALIRRNDVQTAIKAMRCGVADCLEKPFGESELWAVFCKTLESARPTKRQECAYEARRRLATLTDGERSVLRGLINGAANKTIARDLRVSLRTVELRRAHILIKLGANSLPQVGQILIVAGERLK